MSDAHDAIGSAIEEVTKALKIFQKIKTRQIKSKDDRDYAKSLAYSWLKTHRVTIAGYANNSALAVLDGIYTALLEATSKETTCSNYIRLLKEAKDQLVDLRSSLFSIAAQAAINRFEAAPDFSPLASDSLMQAILSRRWDECQKCMQAGAYLAATVMMGAMLETLFVSKANKLKDKSILFKTTSTPTDKLGKPIQLKDWTLNNYINVGHDLQWITKSGKDVAAILREYRNYVHPEKERTYNVVFTEADTGMFWAITKEFVKQLLK